MMSRTAGKGEGIRKRIEERIEKRSKAILTAIKRENETLCRWLLPLPALLSIIPLVLASWRPVDTSGAYFTTYASAKGGYEIQAGTETEIHEEIEGLNKHIRIENTGGADCFVRVKVFAGSVTDISYAPGSGAWQEEDGGYWYYTYPLAPGETTEELVASITIPESMADMAGSFDVIVIQECTPVLYHTDGTAYADWNLRIEKTAGEVG